jgi:hypothetical protein
VRRRAAIKFIKPGMNTRRVLARFDSERQALALMEHPAIARVIDRRRHTVRPPVLRHGVRLGRRAHRAL